MVHVSVWFLVDESNEVTTMKYINAKLIQYGWYPELGFLTAEFSNSTVSDN